MEALFRLLSELQGILDESVDVDAVVLARCKFFLSRLVFYCLQMHSGLSVVELQNSFPY